MAENRQQILRQQIEMQQQLAGVDINTVVNLDEMTPIEQVPPKHLFTLNGVDYYVPGVFGANFSLKILKMVRTEGLEVATGYALEEALGEEAYNALMDYDGLTQEMLQQVTSIVMKMVLSAGGHPL